MIAALVVALALQGGLADRVAAAPDGEVRFSYATRAGVCGNGRNNISFDCEDGWCGRHRMSFGRNDDDDAGCPCEPGPARVALQKRGGQVTRLRVYVGGAWRAAGAGVTDVKESAVFALSQQPRDAGVPALIRIARTHPSPGVRKKALFWLGQSEDPRALALFEEILTERR